MGDWIGRKPAILAGFHGRGEGNRTDSPYLSLTCIFSPKVPSCQALSGLYFLSCLGSYHQNLPRILASGYRFVYRLTEPGEKDRLFVIMRYGVPVEKQRLISDYCPRSLRTIWGITRKKTSVDCGSIACGYVLRSAQKPVFHHHSICNRSYSDLRARSTYRDTAHPSTAYLCPAT